MERSYSLSHFSSTSSASSFSSSETSSATMHRYELYIEDEENNHVECKNALISQQDVQQGPQCQANPYLQPVNQPVSPAKISIYPTPHDTAAMHHLIARAELESDPRVIAIYDRALAPYCCDKRNLRDLLHDNVRFRFLCLNFPQSKTNFIGTLNSAIGTRDGKNLAITLPIKDDQDSALSALLKDVCTKNRLDMLREKHAGYANSRLLEQTPKDFVLALSEQGAQVPSWFFGQYGFFALFYYFLALLNSEEAVHQVACNAIFSYLTQHEIWAQLLDEQIRDLTWLILHQPALLSQLQHNLHDQINIQCKIRSTAQSPAQCTLLTASRFLLCAQSRYFHGILNDLNDEEELDLPDPFGRYTLDLSETSFDSRTLELLLRWISHSRTSAFAFDEHTQIRELESLIASMAAFGLVNQEEFEKTMVIELKKRLNMETVCEITQIGMHYHLNLLIAFIVHFINSYEGGNLCLKEDGQGYYEVLQSHQGHDLPEQVYRALSILGPKIRSASIQTFRPQPAKACCTQTAPGCCSKTVSRLLSFNRKFWATCGGLVKRTAYFALSILSIEKLADKEWMNERDYPIAVGLALNYPLIHHIFSCSVTCLRRNRRPLVISVPGLLPLKCQIKTGAALVRIQENVYGYTQACFKRRKLPAAEPLISNQNLIFNALPSALQSLNLSEATDLCDEDCARISTKFPLLKQLTLGHHPCLSGRQFQFLAHLNLQELDFTFRRGENGLAFKELRLDELLPNRDIKVTISLFDATLVYAPPSFLRYLPDSASLHVSLQHAPIPPSLILFESPLKSGQAVAWPGIAAALSACFPRISSLDCHGPLTDRDLEIISPALTSCRRLVLRQGKPKFPPSGLTNTGIQIIANHSPQLEELFVGISSITSIQPIIESNLPLKKIALHNCTMLQNAALEPLATMPTLSVIHLEQLPHITDLCIHKLLESCSLQECFVTNCAGVSTHMLMSLFQNKTSLNKDTKRAVQEIKQLFNTPLPKQLTKKFLLPILFGTMYTGLDLVVKEMGAEFHSLVGWTPEESRIKWRFPLSLHEATAEFSLNLELFLWEGLRFSKNIRHNRLLIHKEECVPFRPFELNTFKLFFLYCLNPKQQHDRHKIGSAYREFLAHYFSHEYLHEVDVLVIPFIAQLKELIAGNEALKNILLELIALIFLNEHLFFVRLVELFHPQHPVLNKDVFKNFANTIKTRGDALGWSGEQRVTPLLAAVLFHLNLFAELLVPTDGAIEGEGNLSTVDYEWDFDEKFDGIKQEH